MITNDLSCPLCLQPLTRDGQSLKCPNAHSFDVAKEGYVNFLTRKMNADTKEMLLARRQFLEAGYYQPLSSLINHKVLEYLTSKMALGQDKLRILDAGCGEGYYTGQLQTAATQANLAAQLDFFGMDASKEGIKLAAKHYRAITFIVGDINQQWPFADNSLAVLLNIFAPRNTAEFKRVLAANGLLLIVIPEADHLVELRSAFNLLSIEENKEIKLLEKFGEDFQLTDAAQLKYELKLNRTEVANLITMTPNYHHQAVQNWLDNASTETFSTQVSFNVLSFEKKAN